MQAASLREGKCCRLIRVSVIIVGYVRLRLKLNLEAILESKAILLRKSVQAITTKGVSALRLCKPKVEKKLDCSLFISCNILIGPVTQCGRNIHNLGQFYQFIKAVITSTASTPVKSSKHTHHTLDKARPAWRKSKSIRVNSRAAKSPSIEGSTLATKGKSRKSLSFSLLEKIKKPKSL